MSILARLKWLSLVIAGAGFIMGWQAQQDTQLLKELEAEGTEVDGTITNYTSTTRKGNRTYRFNVSYPAGQSTVQKEFKMIRGFAEKYVKGDVLVARDVKVRYAASHPDHAIVVGGSSNTSGIETICYITAGIALALSIVGFVSRPKPSISVTSAPAA